MNIINKNYTSNQYEPHSKYRKFLSYNQNRSNFEDVAFQILENYKCTTNPISDQLFLDGKHNCKFSAFLEPIETNKNALKEMSSWLALKSPPKSDEICIRVYSPLGDIVKSYNFQGLSVLYLDSNNHDGLLYVKFQYDFFTSLYWDNVNLDRKLMKAWAIEHDSHGIYYDTLIFLPEGEEPETDKKWVRCPWLDETTNTK